MSLIRKLMIEARNHLEGREEKDEKICERLLSIIPKEVERVFIYASSSGEVDTRRIIEKLLQDGKQVFCPKVVDVEMMFFPIKSLSDLQPGFHNIPEPVVSEDEIEEKVAYSELCEKDIQILPGVVFDEKGGRIGYGTGSYDRYLQNHPSRKIAICYELQIRYEDLYLKSTDIRYDILVTEDRVIRMDGVDF